VTAATAGRKGRRLPVGSADEVVCALGERAGVGAGVLMAAGVGARVSTRSFEGRPQATAKAVRTPQASSAATSVRCT